MLTEKEWEDFCNFFDNKLVDPEHHPRVFGYMVKLWRMYNASSNGEVH